MTAATISLPLRIGPRTIFQVKRRLVRMQVPLEQGLAGVAPQLPELGPGSDGYLIHALPAALLASLSTDKALRPFVRQAYPRSYASLEGSFDSYLGSFSAKTRSTLKRKMKKLAERSGGQLDVRRYERPDQVEEFFRHARRVSAETYQEKLLNAGLPEGPEAVAGMRALAARDAMRGWLLFLDGEPISYLYAPADGDTLIYAYLGYHPEHAALSPGTMLQLEAMRGLMEERRFRLFDFTEGDGQHKRQFATGSLDCVDLLLVRRTAANLLVGHSLAGFDKAIAGAKALAGRLGLEKLARSTLR